MRRKTGLLKPATTHRHLMQTLLRLRLFDRLLRCLNNSEEERINSVAGYGLCFSDSNRAGLRQFRLICKTAAKPGKGPGRGKTAKA